MAREAASRIGLALAAVLVALAGLEFAIRLLPVHETHWFGRGVDTAAFYRGVELNNLGTRGPDLVIPGTPGVQNVALLGDSFLYGSPIRDYTQTFAYRLGPLAGPSYQLVNLGGPGFNTQTQLEAYSRADALFHFEKALLFYFVNDAEVSAVNEQTRAFFEHTIPGRLGEFLYDHSYLYYFVESRLDRLKEQLGWTMTYAEYVHGTYRDPESLAIHRQMLRDFLASFEAGDVAVVVIPMLDDLADYEYGYIHDYVREVAGESGAPVIDLLDLFGGMEEQKLRVNDYDAHFNEFAHGRVAEYVHDALLAQGFFH